VRPTVIQPVFESFQKNKWRRKWWIKFGGYYPYQDPEPDLWPKARDLVEVHTCFNYYKFSKTVEIPTTRIIAWRRI
jgi:hypothetical protein